MKIIWSPLSVQRAAEEAEYIARDKTVAALSWLEGLFKVTDRLETHPLSGRMVPEMASPDCRELTYKSHRVIYLVGDNAVTILTVRRSKRLLDVSELGLRG